MFSDEQLETMKLAVEDELVYRRDHRISVLRNNGLCIKERDGTPSSLIRMGFEESIIIGLKALERD